MRAVALVLAIVIAILTVVYWTPVFAHDEKHLSDWIGNGGYRSPATKEWCCGVDDCVQVPARDVEFDGRSDSWIIRGVERVPAREALPSEDGRYWRCHRPDGQRRCFFRPPGVS